MAIRQAKTERVQMRIDPAARAIREHERIVLSDRDWELFFDALVDPPEPNAALREAFAAHERLIAKPPGV